MSDESKPNANSEKLANFRLAYEFARDTRDTCDTLAWEVAAIIWGGQTLLLGFVLEAIIRQREVLILILVVAILGVVMAVVNHKVRRTRNDVCNGMIEVMLDLENRLEMEVKPQRILSDKYPAGRQKRLSLILDTAFGGVWVIVFFVAIWMFVCFPKT